MTVALAVGQTKRYGDLVHVNLYLQQTQTQIGDIDHQSTGKWGEWEEVIAAIILCPPEDAIAFGTRLQEEIRQVEQMRVSSGIPDYDPSYFE